MVIFISKTKNNKEDKKSLAVLPTELPVNYLELVNTILKEKDLEQVRHSIVKGTLYGNDEWVGGVVKKHGFICTKSSNIVPDPQRVESVQKSSFLSLTVSISPRTLLGET